jgi:hypothetical protein
MARRIPQTAYLGMPGGHFCGIESLELRRREGRILATPSPTQRNLRRLRRSRRETPTYAILCFRSCTVAPCSPKRSPLSEITCPASSTAVCSLVPVANRIPSNSALDSASDPSPNNRSRGLNSAGSCLMVYLRRSTLVFYIIRSSYSLIRAGFKPAPTGCVMAER